MSKEPRYTMIGVFVVGACAIVVAALLFLGSGSFFRQTKTFVSFFSGSVKGLVVGAPVSFRGARVGSVKEISILFDGKNEDLLIPVAFEVDPESITGLSTDLSVPGTAHSAPLMEKLVRRGLRANLAMESLVTGQLYVALDFFPDTPIQLTGAESQYYEVPTVRSAFEKIRGKIEDLPVEEISKKLLRVLDQVDTFMEAKEIQAVLGDLRGLISEANQVLETVGSKGANLGKEMEVLLQAAYAFLGKAENTLGTIEASLKSNSPAMRDVLDTLKEVSAASRSIKQLTDYLQTHPETLLRGKR